MVFIFLYVHVIPLILLYCLSHFDLSWSDQPVQVRPSRKRSWVNLVLFHEFNSAWRDVTVYVFISRYRWFLYSLYQFYSYGSEFLVLSSKYSMKIQLHWRCLIKVCNDSRADILKWNPNFIMYMHMYSQWNPVWVANMYKSPYGCLLIVWPQ